jgi:hypothetical protein
VSDLLEALDAAERALAAEQLPVQALIDLATAVRAAAEHATPEQAAALGERFGALLDATQKTSGETTAALRELTKNRRAIRGFAHLRSNALGQRVRTKA